MNRTELPVGMRVHHRAGEYSYGWNPAIGEGGHYWGTIIEVDPRHYSDGSREYLVQPDAALLDTMENSPSWWASYHIDQTNGVVVL